MSKIKTADLWHLQKYGHGLTKIQTDKYNDYAEYLLSQRVCKNCKWIDKHEYCTNEESSMCYESVERDVSCSKFEERESENG